MGEACQADLLIGVLLEYAPLFLLLHHSLLFVTYAIVFPLAFGCEGWDSLPHAWVFIPCQYS